MITILTCPNCGAPTSRSGICGYCRTEMVNPVLEQATPIDRQTDKMLAATRLPGLCEQEKGLALALFDARHRLDRAEELAREIGRALDGLSENRIKVSYALAFLVAVGGGLGAFARIPADVNVAGSVLVAVILLFTIRLLLRAYINRRTESLRASLSDARRAVRIARNDVAGLEAELSTVRDEIKALELQQG
jgi:low affinity Fe/Cu permease